MEVGGVSFVMLIGIGRTVVGCTLEENLPGRLDKVETPGMVIISHWIYLGMLLMMVG